jgi:hypothetical protein
MTDDAFERLATKAAHARAEADIKKRKRHPDAPMAELLAKGFEKELQERQRARDSKGD